MSFIADLGQYYTYTTTTTTSEPLSAAGVVTVIIVGLIAYVVTAWLLGRIFKKAGVAQWIAWVPFYNNWKTLQLGGQKGYWAVLAIIPILNIVAAIIMYIAYYEIGKRLGKSGVFVLWAIFLPIVWMIWLAFDSSKWQGPTVAGPTEVQPTTTA